MLIRISETMAINTQQVIRIYVKKVFDGYEVIGETLDHLYTIKNVQQEQKQERHWKKYSVSTTEDKGLSSYKGVL